MGRLLLNVSRSAGGGSAATVSWPVTEDASGGRTLELGWAFACPQDASCRLSPTAPLPPVA